MNKLHGFAKIFVKKTCVRVVVNYTDIQFSNLVIKHLRENEKVRETVLACSCGAQV